MNAEEFAKSVIEIIKAEPSEIMQFIEKEDWDGLQDEIYYLARSAMEG